MMRRPTQAIYRHPLPVRLTHWLSALALIILAMSGMQIFNAHPALYAADASNFAHPVLRIGARQAPDGTPVGFLQIGSHVIRTTGVLGYGPDGLGGMSARAFPSWATIPSYQDLADGRRWHFFFAWVFVICGLVYAPWAVRLLPTRCDLRAVPAALREHLPPWRVKPALRLNPLQKVSYAAIVLGVAPLVIFSGLALSPAVDAWAPWLPQLFGGRQFARIWHFGAMLALMFFFIVHLSMVALTGLTNNLRSMITGWLRVPAALAENAPVADAPCTAPLDAAHPDGAVAGARRGPPPAGVEFG